MGWMNSPLGVVVLLLLPVWLCLSARIAWLKWGEAQQKVAFLQGWRAGAAHGDAWWMAEPAPKWGFGCRGQREPGTVGSSSSMGLGQCSSVPEFLQENNCSEQSVSKSLGCELTSCTGPSGEIVLLCV